jgi:hypothetical protein
MDFLDEIIREQRLLTGTVTEAHSINIPKVDQKGGKTWHGLTPANIPPRSLEDQNRSREIQDIIDQITDNLKTIEDYAVSQYNSRGDFQRMKFLNQALEHIVKIELGL